MDQWSHRVDPIRQSEIRPAVIENCWQEFRQRLKGLPTEVKLQKLDRYRFRHLDGEGRLPRRYQVQIDNYINALRRGGLLDSEYRVVKNFQDSQVQVKPSIPGGDNGFK